jgi:UDP-N-acetylmuramoyl-tripeptide--D-alanyl-D-alanine ligase
VALLDLKRNHQYAVLEMAMYDVGEIALLCQIAEPRHGVVTNIGPVHLERLGSMERIAQAKGELVEALPNDGVAVLNADDGLVRSLATKTKAQVLWYGFSPERRPSAMSIWASEVESSGLAGVSFNLHWEGRAKPVRMLLMGRHQVRNALAAAGVALTVGMSLEEVVEALQTGRPANRLVVHQGWNGFTLLDDTYNASPASMIAALELMSELDGRHVAVLGDMRELGRAAESSHREIGRQLKGKADVLVAVGELGRLIADEAQSLELPSHWAPDGDAATDLLQTILTPGDVVLVKGSRALALDRVVEKLIAGPKAVASLAGKASGAR